MKRSVSKIPKTAKEHFVGNIDRVRSTPLLTRNLCGAEEDRRSRYDRNKVTEKSCHTLSNSNLSQNAFIIFYPRGEAQSPTSTQGTKWIHQGKNTKGRVMTQFVFSRFLSFPVFSGQSRSKHETLKGLRLENAFFVLLCITSITSYGCFLFCFHVLMSWSWTLMPWCLLAPAPLVWKLLLCSRLRLLACTSSLHRGKIESFGTKHATQIDKNHLESSQMIWPICQSYSSLTSVHQSTTWLISFFSH